MGNPDFEIAIQGCPTDKTLRLVYADWLEEHRDIEYSNWQKAVAKLDGPIPNLLYDNFATMNVLHRWSYVYIHGLKSEATNNYDDRFLATHSMPTSPGEHPVLINFNPAWAVIDWHVIPNLLCGRVTLIDDTEALKHTRNPKDWR